MKPQVLIITETESLELWSEISRTYTDKFNFKVIEFLDFEEIYSRFDSRVSNIHCCVVDFRQRIALNRKENSEKFSDAEYFRYLNQKLYAAHLIGYIKFSGIPLLSIQEEDYDYLNLVIEQSSVIIWDKYYRGLCIESSELLGREDFENLVDVLINKKIKNMIDNYNFDGFMQKFEKLKTDVNRYKYELEKAGILRKEYHYLEANFDHEKRLHSRLQEEVERFRAKFKNELNRIEEKYDVPDFMEKLIQEFRIFDRY